MKIQEENKFELKDSKNSVDQYEKNEFEIEDSMGQHETNNVIKELQDKKNELIKNNDIKSVKTGEKSNEIDTLQMERQDTSEETTSYSFGLQKYLSLLPYIPVTPVYPDDYRIGSLHKTSEASTEAQVIEKNITRFFLDMKKKEINTSLLYIPDSDENLETEQGSSESKLQENKDRVTESELYRLLMYHVDNETIPLEIRIGTITVQNNDTAQATVRLFGKEGGTHGEVYLKKMKTEWYISDIQINFYELEIPRDKDQDEFMPTTYQWLYEGM